MSDRERMLKELNLYPLWVRRDLPAEEGVRVAVPAGEVGAAAAADARDGAESAETHEAISPADSRSAVMRTASSAADIGHSAQTSTADTGRRARTSVTDRVHPAQTSAADTAHPSQTPDAFAREPAVATQPAADQDDARARAIADMAWPALKEAVRACTACPLHAQRKQSVFGVGDENADWLFIGEGPGADEDARGEPFVGQAGKLLDNMLASIGLARGQDVYIANIVKCRPPGNRTPEPVEARCCEPFLQRQITLLRPRLIVALGKTAAENLLGREASIASLRGRTHDYNGMNLIVTYHPAYLLRNLPDKAKAWEDLCFARDTMQRLKSGDVAAI